jgi:peptide deformylase
VSTGVKFPSHAKTKRLARCVAQTAARVKLPQGFKVCGLASVQIGAPSRLFAMRSAPHHRFHVLVNPRVVRASPALCVDWEMCASLPSVLKQVVRPEAVVVEYQTLGARLVRQRFTGLLARAFQHELDHLNGLLIVDY